MRTPASAALDEALLEETTVAEQTKVATVVPTALATETWPEEPDTRVEQAANEATPAADGTPGPVQDHHPTQGRSHAFVVMPFGQKQTVDGTWLDFNAIYKPCKLSKGIS